MKLHSILYRARYTWRHMPTWAKLADAAITAALITGAILLILR